jgi:hypothetical protein
MNPDKDDYNQNFDTISENLDKYYERSHAIIIGINQYKEETTLTNAFNDANAIMKVLQEKYGFSIMVSMFNESATADQMRELFYDTLQDREKIGPKDRVLVYYSGHGKLRIMYGRDGAEIKEGFIVPYESKKVKFGSKISMKIITEACQNCPAKHVLLILDCCYRGFAAIRTGEEQKSQILTRDYIKDISSRTARQVLAAGQEDEPVSDSGIQPGYSAFTAALLEILETDMDPDNDGILTASEIGTTLEQKIASQEQRGSYQRPVYNHVSGSGMGDFIFKIFNGEKIAERSNTIFKEKAKREAKTSPKKKRLNEVQIISIISGAVIGAILITLIIGGIAPFWHGPIHVPIANAGGDQTVNENASVILDGSSSKDPGGSIVSYSWKQTAGPLVKLTGINTIIAKFKAPFVTANSMLTFVLTVTDNNKVSSTDETRITVIHVPPPPRAIVETNSKVVSEGEVVTLDGSRSTGDGITYYWYQTGGNPFVSTINGNTSKLTFTAPVVSSDIVLTFDLTVTDKTGKTDSTIVKVTVKPIESSRVTYGNSTMGIAFTYPANWTINERNNYINLTSPRSNAFNFGQPMSSITTPASLAIIIHQAPQNESLAAYSDHRIKSLSSGYAKMNYSFKINSSKLTEIAGTGSYQIAFTSTPKAAGLTSMLTLTHLQIWTIKNNKIYIIDYSASPSLYFQYLHTIHDIIDSLEI